MGTDKYRSKYEPHVDGRKMNSPMSRDGTSKRCGRCGVEKPVGPKGQFGKDRSTKDGWTNYCKVCCGARQLDAYLRHAYGITAAEYNRLFEEQNFVCAICKQPETMRHLNNSVLRLAVDHHHDTGNVRGLVCNRCNQAIAGVEYLRNVGLLQTAIEYLDSHKANQFNVSDLFNPEPAFDDVVMTYCWLDECG